MAVFEEAHPEIIRIEGGYRLVQVPGDRGGQTYAGLSRRANPDWPGWRIIDSEGDRNAQLPTLADGLFRNRYWDVIKGDLIDSQALATLFYSCAVLSGVRTATRMVQIAVGVDQDGIVGQQTVSAINAAPEALVMAKLTLTRVARFVAICNNDRSQTKFLLGWLNRALGGAA